MLQTKRDNIVKYTIFCGGGQKGGGGILMHASKKSVNIFFAWIYELQSLGGSSIYRSDRG